MFLGKFFIGLNPYHHRSEQDGKYDESFKKTMFCDFGKLIAQDKRKVLGNWHTTLANSPIAFNYRRT